MQMEQQINNSDVDILVEINKEHPSLFDAGAIQYYMQDMLDLKVDVIIYPLKEGTRFKIGKTVRFNMKTRDKENIDKFDK
jgi:predicted nucleotidyltransferase